MSESTCKSGYCFLYNDEDKSVKYASPDYIKGLAVSDVIMQDSRSNFNKYRLMFEKSYDEYLYDVCTYLVDNVFVHLRLIVTDVDACIALSFHDRDSFTIELRCFVDFEDLGFDCGLSYSKSLSIPFRMVDYILSLKSKGDFDGIMNAFSGCIGVDLHKYILQIRSSVVRFESWD